MRVSIISLNSPFSVIFLLLTLKYPSFSTGNEKSIDFDSPVASSAAKISESTGSSTAMTAEEVALEIHTKTIKIRNLLKGSRVLDKMQEKG